LQAAHVLSAYLRTGIFAKLRLNHFFWRFPTVPSAISFFITPSTIGVSLDHFWSTAPYTSCVTTWPATGPYADGFCFF
jgi:hypothetical protein